MFRRLILLVFLISNLSAHPVIFKNGKVFWLTQNPTYNDLRFGISKTSNWYIGFRLLEDRKEEKTFALMNNNILAKRWNNENSQANLYLLSSVGLNTKSSRKKIAKKVNLERLKNNPVILTEKNICEIFNL